MRGPLVQCRSTWQLQPLHSRTLKLLRRSQIHPEPGVDSECVVKLHRLKLGTCRDLSRPLAKAVTESFHFPLQDTSRETQTTYCGILEGDPIGEHGHHLAACCLLSKSLLESAGSVLRGH